MRFIAPQQTLYSLRHFVSLLIAGLTLLSAMEWWQLMDIKVPRNTTAAADASAKLSQDLNTDDVVRALSGSQTVEVAAVDESWRLIGVLKEKRGMDVVLVSLNGERPVIATIGEQLGNSQWRLKEVSQFRALFVDAADSNIKLELELQSNEPSSPSINSQPFITQPFITQQLRNKLSNDQP